MARAHTTFDLDDDLIEEIKRTARREERSVSAVMRMLIREALQARKQKMQPA